MQWSAVLLFALLGHFVQIPTSGTGQVSLPGKFSLHRSSALLSSAQLCSALKPFSCASSEENDMLLSFDVKLQWWHTHRCKRTENATLNLRTDNLLVTLIANVQSDPVPSMLTQKKSLCLGRKSLKKTNASQARTKTAPKKREGQSLKIATSNLSPCPHVATVDKQNWQGAFPPESQVCYWELLVNSGFGIALQTRSHQKFVLCPTFFFFHVALHKYDIWQHWGVHTYIPCHTMP